MKSRNRIVATLAIVLSPLGTTCSPAAEMQVAVDMPIPIPSDAPWGRVLEQFHDRGGLDYEALLAAPDDLDAYLASLGAARPAEVSSAERIAFWSNAYNAVTAKFVIERYPGIKSVRDVDGFFDNLTFPVAGEQLTLDTIETRARAEGDPRVHFAVVCASTSCPDLRFEPYRGVDLERQLQEQTTGFFADPDKGMRLDGDELWLSSIFKWYAGDFTGGSTLIAFVARGKIRDWVLSHLADDLAAEIVSAKPSVRYLDYNWSLNDR